MVSNWFSIFFLQFLLLPTNSKELSVFLTILLMIILIIVVPNGPSWKMIPDESLVTTVATQLKLSDILSYAHRISYTTFAPTEFGGGQAPLWGALPPAPQDEQMRASQLYNFADLDVGLPKTDEGKENILEPLIEPSAESNPLFNLSAIQGLVPPNIVVPSGWKPGMPVELPTDLPLPPPGWKPGDPIALPPVILIHFKRSRRHQHDQYLLQDFQECPIQYRFDMCSLILMMILAIIVLMRPAIIALIVKIDVVSCFE